MQFILRYDGPLQSDGNATHKHEIRQCFHKQLSVLWRQRPLYNESLASKDESDGDPYIENIRNTSEITKLKNFSFSSLISERAELIAEIDIILLSASPLGGIFKKGDIDNRLKTLFDALAVPQKNALPKGAKPEASESPYFFCLLEDDNLITKVSVETNRLLKSQINKNEVSLFIRVTPKVIEATTGNIHIGV